MVVVTINNFATATGNESVDSVFVFLFPFNWVDEDVKRLKTVICAIPKLNVGLHTKALPEGKLPIEVLKPILDSIRSNNLVVPPRIGIDVGISKTHGKYLVSSSDPITGTDTMMGWHAVNVSANDVATSGIMPEVINVVSLFPNKTQVKEINRVMAEINETARGHGITVAGGHTEITPGLRNPIIVVTAFGSGSKFVTAAGAKSGDSIIMTKSAGLEGTSILSRLRQVKKIVGPIISRSGSLMIRNISIVADAGAAFGTNKIHAMHDVTEGGVLGAVLEMSLASNVGFDINSESIPIENATKVICEKLELDPLKLIGSGSLLIACAPSNSQSVLTALSNRGIKATVIGEFISKNKGRQIRIKGKRKIIKDPCIEDELWRALRKYGNFS